NDRELFEQAPAVARTLSAGGRNLQSRTPMPFVTVLDMKAAYWLYPQPKESSVSPNESTFRNASQALATFRHATGGWRYNPAHRYEPNCQGPGIKPQGAASRGGCTPAQAGPQSPLR